jgi:hypothetical protein
MSPLRSITSSARAINCEMPVVRSLPVEGIGVAFVCDPKSPYRKFWAMGLTD